MGDSVEIIKAFVSPAEKLIDNICKAIGMVYKPRYERKMADAKVYEINAISEAIQKCLDLPVTYKNGELCIDSTDETGLIQRAIYMKTLQITQKHQNIERIIDKTYEMLKNSSTVDNTPIDEDWLNRFFNITENIKSEDMQLIWAKILAGETEAPGSFSVRTLEMVKNLSKEEAAVFQKILPLTIVIGKDRAIVSDEKILEKYGMSYGDILLLDECGMINASSAQILKSIRKGETVNYLTHTHIMNIICSGDKQVDVSLGIYKLTKPAVELLGILAHEPNEEYFCDIAESIFRSHDSQGISVSVHIIESRKEDSCTYATQPICEFR